MHALELFVLARGAAGEAIALARRGPDTAIAEIDIDDDMRQLAAFSTVLSSVVEGGQRPSTQEVVEIGQRAFGRVFCGDVLDLYNRVPPGSPLSIQIVSNNPDVLGVPWEFLAPPDLAPMPHPDRCIVRVHPMRSARTYVPARRRERMRVLLAVAEPVNEPGVGWGDVESAIRASFRGITDDVAELTVIEAADPQSIQSALTRRRYDVFHFLGHGRMVGNVGHLVLLNAATGASQPYSGADLATLLANRGLRLCILSACESGVGDTTRNSFNSVAASVLRAGVPAVVANQAVIPTRSIPPFVSNLYAVLVTEGNIDAAVMQGRIALNIALRPTLKDDEAVIEWGIPTLYRQPGASQLFAKPKGRR